MAGVMAVKINSRLAPTQWVTITGCSEVYCFLVGAEHLWLWPVKSWVIYVPTKTRRVIKSTVKPERCALMYNVYPFRSPVVLFQDNIQLSLCIPLCVSVCMHFLLSRAGLVCHCLSFCGNPNLHSCVDPPLCMFIGIMWMHTQAY